MIVYRSDCQWADPRQALESLAQEVERWRAQPPDHEHVVSALIDFGVIESAAADAVAPEQDAIHPLTRAMRQVARSMGHVFWHSWRGDRERLTLWSASLRCEIRDLLDQHLPDRIKTSVPEGYAWYGLHPEGYLEAAVQFVQDARPAGAICIGIRSIGTGLSAVVEAALRESGVATASYTVRPRGHPFDRRPKLAPGLARAITARPDRFYLIVDEGPGISGSSMAGVAQTLAELGVADERIVLFPSWCTDGRNLRSELARTRWSRHRQYVTPYAPKCATRCLDLSAGQWRTMLLGNPDSFPAVQPQHERLKYLQREGEQPVLRKFCGLGRYGSASLERAWQLHAAGFVAEPLGLADGLLAMRWVSGVPCTAADAQDHALFDTAVRYLGFLHRDCPGQSSMSIGALCDMIRINVEELLGAEWRERLEQQPVFRSPAANGRPIALDARMLPHEWIRSDAGYLKTDALDHHADHFIPGCQDIAWDLAGFAVEFRLSEDAREVLLKRFARASDPAGARDLNARLRFHTLAYLAFRLGYARLAMESLSDAAEVSRFAAEGRRYGELLQGELAAPHAGLWAAK